jgi:hypothetical protein
MAQQLTRKEMIALYRLFNTFSLEDQRLYYQKAINKHRAAAKQVNQLRATFALLTGLSSALAALIVALSDPTMGSGLHSIVVVLIVIAIIAPVIGGALGTLMDLYQWERLVSVYEVALQNIEVADALSPDDMDPDDKYHLAYTAFAEGTLSVMRDESAQWGQLIRPPRQIEEFLAQQARIAQEVSRTPYTQAQPGSPTTPPSPVTPAPDAGPPDTSPKPPVG